MATPVKINIMDKEYLVACPENEKAGLIESARYLSGKMREIRNTGKVVGLDRIAVMAALNITHELLNTKGHDGSMDEIGDRLKALNNRLSELDEETAKLAGGV